MIKLFATDLDGTLLKDNQYIEDFNQNTLRKLYKQGIEITFATGRSDHDIVTLFDEIGINGHRVSQNGAFVIDKDGETIIEHQFSKELSNTLYHAIKEYPAYYFVSTGSDIFYNQDIPIIDELQPLFKNRLVHNELLTDEINHKHDISRFMLLAETDQLLSIQAEINQKFDGEISSFISAPLCLDVVPAGVNKALGINYLLKHIDIDVSEIAVIGDSYNDIDMLKMTQHSYAMDIADDEVKKVANYVVGSVSEAVEHLRKSGLL